MGCTTVKKASAGVELEDNSSSCFISIIIPCFNLEDHIDKCLYSIFNQDFVDYEIILVDDKSTDNTLSILKKYERIYDHVTVLETEGRNAGVARNYGLKHARGRFLWFVDGDDYLEIDALKNLKKDLGGIEPDVYLIGSSYYDEKTRKSSFIGGKDLTLFSRYGNGEVLGDEDRIKLLYLAGFPWNKIFSHKFIRNNNIKFQDVYIHNDLRFYIEAMLTAQHVVIDEKWHSQPYYVHVKRKVPSDSLTHVFDKRSFIVFDVLRSTLSISDSEKTSEDAKVALLAMAVSNIKHRVRFLKRDEQVIRFEREAADLLCTFFSNEIFYQYFRYDDAEYSCREYCFNLLYEKRPELFNSIYEKDELWLSVIVTTYNLEDYLDEAMSFIKPLSVKLPHSKYEVIIVDDASTDSTQEIISKWCAKSDHVKSVMLNENSIGGVSTVANIGIKEAKGSYLAFLDGDDLLNVDVLFEGLTKAICFDSDILLADFQKLFMQSKSVSGAKEDDSWNFILNRIRSNRNDIYSMQKLSLEMNPVPWRKIYKTSFLHDNKIFFPEVDFFHEDNPFHWYCITQASTITFLKKQLVIHRYERQGQTMSSFKEKKGALAMHNHLMDISLFLRTNEIYEVFENAYSNTVRRYIGIYRGIINDHPDVYTKYRGLAISTTAILSFVDVLLPIGFSSGGKRSSIPKPKPKPKPKLVSAKSPVIGGSLSRLPISDLVYQLECYIDEYALNFKSKHALFGKFISPFWVITRNMYFFVKHKRRKILKAR